MENINEKLQDPRCLLTGRVKRYLENPDSGLAPASCTMLDYNNDVLEAMVFVSRGLRSGAGVKTQLGQFQAHEPQELPEWAFYVDPVHPDIDKIPSKYEPYRVKSVDKLQDYHRIIVEDSMEATFGIEQSWEYFKQALENDEPVCVDLSKIRPAGTVGSHGMIATGAFGNTTTDPEAGSFLSLYEKLYNFLAEGNIESLLHLLGQINKTLLRGGKQKRGIVCTAIDYDNPNVWDYLNAPLPKLPGSQKKGIRVETETLYDLELSKLIVDKVNIESLFLEKIDQNDRALMNNVCEEVKLHSRGTCNLSHVNLGQCKNPQDIIDALSAVTRLLAELWASWRDTNKYSDMYLSAEEDRQIGVGMVGLANYLALHNISYEQHVQALEDLLYGSKTATDQNAIELAEALYVGYHKAAAIAVDFGLDRAFTMAPTQRSAYDNVDAEGRTLCRSIDPPFGKRERRNSGREGVIWCYHGEVETMRDVSPQLHERHWEAWQKLIDTTGKAQTMSYDLWWDIDIYWLEKFITQSPLQTTYYNQTSKIDQSFLYKGKAITMDVESQREGECQTCAE